MYIPRKVGTAAKKTLSAFMAASFFAMSAELEPMKISAEEGRSYSFALANVKADEGEYNAFVRLGKEFYEKNVAGKYSECSGAITQESVYAFEYALNKDILSSKTIERLIKNRFVDKAGYAETVNSFCAAMTEQIYVQRENNGITAPDFDDLTLNGYDLFNCRTASEYLARYAVLDKNALWTGDHACQDSDWCECVNDELQLVFGWVRRPDGTVVLQTADTFSNVTTNLYEDDHYYFILSNDRYYFLLHGILQDNVNINFNDYDSSAEDRDISIPLDSAHGIGVSEFENAIGDANSKLFNESDSIRYYIKYDYDYSLPVQRDDEYSRYYELVCGGTGEFSVNALDTVKLDVSVIGDDSDWFDENNIYFTSSNPSVADVDYRGNIYGISEGDAVITAVAKTSGICRPLQVNIHVNNSSAVNRSFKIGYIPENINFDMNHRSICFDALTDKVFADGASSVMISDMPVFCLDGKTDFSTGSVTSGELTLVHGGTDGIFDHSIKYSDYRALADMAHKKGIKVYAYLMPVWNDGGLWDGSAVSGYFERYANDPTDNEAKLFVDKYFKAYENYWLEAATKLEAAGVDGIYLNYECNFELYIKDGHWSDLISKIRTVYGGELLAMVSITWPGTSDKFADNSDFFGNIDRIGSNYDLLTDYSSAEDNMDLDAARELIKNRFPMNDIEKLHELYGKPFDIKTGITGTDKPDCGIGSTAGKGKRYSAWDLSTLIYADYLQQMIVWQAFCDVLSDKEYIDTIYSKYNTNSLCGDYGCDFRSGYDCGTTVYEKPASKLLERNSIRAPFNDALKQANAALALAGDKYAVSEAAELKNAIAAGYTAETADAVNSAAAEIISIAAEVTKKAVGESANALSAARTDLRNTVSSVPSSQGYSSRSYAVLADAVSNANTVLSDKNSVYSDFALAKSDIEAAVNALVKMPDSVENVRVIPGDTFVTVKWNRVEDADSYRILYSGKSIDVGDTDSYIIKGLTNGQEYSFSVQYTENGSYSAGSAEVTASPEEFAPVMLNVRPDESEYSAFIRLGKEFYENNIKDKYPDEDGSIINQNSVYAFEYALNKDILSDRTIDKLVRSNYIDLPTYAETVNSFCAEMLQATDDEKIQNGIAAPDFDDLTLYGYDLYRSRDVSHYLYRHAILDKNAAWDGTDFEYNNNVIRNENGDLVFGWVKMPDGKILLQNSNGPQEIGVRSWINGKYQFVQSNDRIYFVDSSGVLRKGSVTVNFADYVPENASWWEGGLLQPEDRDIVIPLDTDHGIGVDDFEELIGKNAVYFYQGETFHNMYVFFHQDYSLPNERTDEYNDTKELIYNGDEIVFMDCFKSVKLNVTVKNDSDGWYGKNMFFTSSDPLVAEVDDLGNVYGISEGDTIITGVTRTSGICRPVRIKVHVNDSPEIKRSFDIGYELEDCLYDSCSRSIYFDALAEKVNRDGGDHILIPDQPQFCLNGNSQFNDNDIINGELTLEQKGDTAISIDDYRTLAREAHKNGTKLYVFLQPYWHGEIIDPESSYIPTMLKQYAEDPNNAEAAKVTDQYFGAIKNYWLKYAPIFEEAGIDGIYVHNWQSFEESVSDEHWPELISAVRQVYNGKLLAMISTDYSKFEMYQNMGYIFDNVDKIECFFQWFNYSGSGFVEKNPSLDECKRIFTETKMEDHYGYRTMPEFLQLFYDLYHKPMDLKLYVTCTDCPTTVAGNCAGKGKSMSVVGGYGDMLSVDYLQQMTTLRAILEVISDVDYIEDFTTYYAFSNLERPDVGYDTSSGYDCSASVYDKPGAQLLAFYSKRSSVIRAERKALEALALAGDKYAVSETAQLKKAIEAGYAAETEEAISAAANEILLKTAEVKSKVKQETEGKNNAARTILKEKTDSIPSAAFYTDDMYAVLSPAVENAKAVLSDNNSSYDEIIEASSELDDAEAVLVDMIEAADIEQVIDFVNKFSAAAENGDCLREVHIRAVEIVLDHDYGR